MDEFIISLIIPVYNTGVFLEKCLLSAINQTYKDLEIVVLNNGSTDNSDEIIKKYSHLDSRIRYFSINHVSTGCESRNIAILRSNYDWIIPIDSDDFIEPEYVSKLVRRQKETNADFVGSVMVGNDIKTGDVKFTIPNNSFNFKQIIKGEEAVSLTIGDWYISANGALMKKNILPCVQRGDAKPIYNDEYETREILYNASLVAFAKASYFYSLNPDSTGKKKSFSKLVYLPTTHLGLIRLVKEKYGINSVEYLKEQRIVASILAHSLHDSISYNKILSQDEKNKYSKLLTELYNEYHVEITNIKSVLTAVIYVTNRFIFG